MRTKFVYKANVFSWRYDYDNVILSQRLTRKAEAEKRQSRHLSLIFMLMKKLFVFLALIFSIFGANAIAQDNILILDRSNVECIYSHTVFDPQLKETQTYNMLLQVGDKYSKYAQYANFRIDSVIMRTNEQISFNAYRRLAKL